MILIHYTSRSINIFDIYIYVYEYERSDEDECVICFEEIDKVKNTSNVVLV